MRISRNNSSTSLNNSRANSQDFLNTFDDVKNDNLTASLIYIALKENCPILYLKGTEFLVQTERQGYERLYAQDEANAFCFYFKDYVEINQQSGARTLRIDTLANDVENYLKDKESFVNNAIKNCER